MSTTQVINQVKNSITILEKLRNEALTPVERVDLTDIRTDLESAMVKLEALQAYQATATTDYAMLWKTRKKELEDYERIQQSWIRAEIFTHLLKSTSPLQ